MLFTYTASWQMIFPSKKQNIIWQTNPDFESDSTFLQLCIIKYNIRS